jgi:hypothetical protein
MYKAHKILIAGIGNRSDAKKLVSWWNANTGYYHFIQMLSKKYYNVLRQL